MEKKSLKHELFVKFLQGIAFGLGTTIGVSVVLTLLGFLIKQVNLIPVIGGFVSQILNFVLQNNPNLVK